MRRTMGSTWRELVLGGRSPTAPPSSHAFDSLALMPKPLDAAARKSTPVIGQSRIGNRAVVSTMLEQLLFHAFGVSQ